MQSIDITNCSGYELSKYMNKNNKFKLVIKSFPYNDNGAYYPFETGYITKESKLYETLVNNSNIKNLYIDYYNNVKDKKEKDIYNMPLIISVDQIANIRLDILPSNYVDYYLR